MESTVTIPLLKDHHSHPLFYSAFNHAISLDAVHDKQVAENILSQSFEQENGGLTVAHGWRSNRYHWSQNEIELMPPLAVFNVSLHSLTINRGGMNFLRSKYGDIVNQLADPIWYENNLRVVLNWFAKLYASRESLTKFFVQLNHIGIHYLEEMLLVDEEEIQIFDDCNLLNRTRFWSAPDTFLTLSPKAKSQVHGLKLFTDGAIGSGSAALHRPFLNGKGDNRGILIYTDSELTHIINQSLETEKSLAIHKEIGLKGLELETTTYLYLSYKHLSKDYDLNKINRLIKDAEDIEFELNFRLYELLEDSSYLKTAYSQVQENASAMDEKLAKKFLSYPIPKAVVEAWEKVK